MTIPVWLTIALPLAGATILLLGGRRTNAWGHLLGTAASLGSFAVGAMLFTDMLGRGAEHRTIHEALFSWVPVAGLQPEVDLHPGHRHPAEQRLVHRAMFGAAAEHVCEQHRADS